MIDASYCCQSTPTKIEVDRLDRHSALKGNGCDTYYYEFSTNISLKGLPTLLLEAAIEEAINMVVSKTKKTIG